MKRIVFAAVVLLLSLSGFAQNKLLTIEDAVMKGRTTLAPARLNQLNWVTGTTKISFIGKRADKDVLIVTTAEQAINDTILSIDELAAALKAADDKASPLARFPGISWVSDKSFRFYHGTTFYLYNLENKKCFVINRLINRAENVDFEPTSNAAAYTLENNLYVSFGESVAQVTSYSMKGMVSGQTVHRNEFGISKGTFWSPKGKYMAYYRMDESMVDEYPIMDLNKKPATPDMIRYPMAGKASHQVKVGIFEASSKSVIELKTGFPSDQYLTNIAWDPNEEMVYVAVLNREQNHMQLNQYSAFTGDFIKTLFEEKSTKYVEPEHPVQFVTGQPDLFIWQSERDGYNHLYLYNRQGKLIRQLTKGAWVVTDVLGFDSKGEYVYIQATKESPLERHIYAVQISSGKLTKISAAVSGTHTAQFNSGFTHFIDNYSSVNVPRNIDVISADGKPVRNLLTAANPLADYRLPEMSMFTLKTADGTTDLHCRMFKPLNFDATKKYPVLVYLYGGPHLQLVNNTFMGGADLWLVYMAQQGYVVFTLDNRGSLNRGRDFEQATHLQLGNVEMSDQLQGVNYLKNQSFVDTTRMGVYGWSFGGFMTTSLMTRNAGVFKAAVAGGPVIDWSMYEVMYTERYMSTPQENKKGFDESNLLNHAGKLKGKLLMIHGTSDDVVVWQHSLKFLEECVKQGVLVDYFVYPGHKHNVLGPDRVHLMKKITQYFKENL